MKFLFFKNTTLTSGALNENNALKNIIFRMAITGSVIAPGFFNLRLHHAILFVAALTLCLWIGMGRVQIKLERCEIVLLLSFTLIPFFSGIYSGYLLSSTAALQELALFCWTAIIWLFFFKYAEYWDWRKILYTIILGDVFIAIYIIKAIWNHDYYIPTTESCYSYLIPLISMLYYRSPISSKNFKFALLMVNFLFSLIVFLFFSTSRGALFGLLPGLLGFSFPVFIAALGIIKIAPLISSKFNNVAPRIEEGIQQLSQHSGTAAERYVLWEKIARSSVENPIGTGAGGYRAYIGDQFIQVAESLYMEILSAGGLLLLTIFIIFLVNLAYKIYKRERRLTLFFLSPLIMMATNPIGFHPIIPLYITVVLFIARNKT
jgi:hypothetical protein